VPEVVEADSLIAAPRVLAIRAQPAQLRPREAGTFSALVVSPDGTEQEASLNWAFCKARKPLAELGPVNPLCLLDDAGDTAQPVADADEDEEPAPILEGLGDGVAAAGDMPSDACRLFGPERPAPQSGEPSGRPVDPDATGGYYQPLRIFNPDDDSVALFQARIVCGLPGAGQAITRAFNQRFVPNENPAIAELAVTNDGDRALPLAVGGRLARVRPGETLELELRWDECDALPPCEVDAEECEEPAACTGAESYIYYDPLAHALSDRRESMRVSWFATGGVFRSARTGRTAHEADTAKSDNAWTAPDAEGDVTLWAVLRDDRGGVAWQAYSLRIER
jgi:hypothetical protein